MATLLSALGGAPFVPGSVRPLTASEADLALINALPSLRAWWRADDGWSPQRWIDRAYGLSLDVFRSSGKMPARRTNGVAGRPYLEWKAGQDGILASPVGSNLIPLGGAFTVAWVGRPGVDGSGAVVGNNRDTSGTGALWFGYAYSPSGEVQASLRSSSGGELYSSPATFPYASGLSAPVISFDPATTSGVMRVNGVERLRRTDITRTAEDSRLLVGGVASSASIGLNDWRGQLYELFVFSDALHKTALAPQLTALEAYIKGWSGLG